jgi:cytochrome c oxidase subunit 1
MADIDHPEDRHDAGARPHIHLPAPSIWPVTLAAGITLLAFGVLTSIVFVLSGVALMAISLGGWVQELRHE